VMTVCGLNLHWTYSIIRELSLFWRLKSIIIMFAESCADTMQWVNDQ
jgi:hypothetical protein